MTRTKDSHEAEVAHGKRVAECLVLPQTFEAVRYVEVHVSMKTVTISKFCHIKDGSATEGKHYLTQRNLIGKKLMTYSV